MSPDAPPPAPVTRRLEPPSPPSPRPGCFSRLLGLLNWLLTLTLSAALGIAALAAIAYFIFGFTLATPTQIRQTGVELAALQATDQALASEVTQLRTAEAVGARERATATARVGELETQLGELQQQAAGLRSQAATAAALARELDENIALAATIQAEGREAQVLVAVVATVQAENSARLGELQQRTDRIARFLTRLSDLAGDLEPGSTAPTPTSVVTPTPVAATPTPAVTPTP